MAKATRLNMYLTLVPYVLAAALCTKWENAGTSCS
jgi:hypothetical protein